MRIGLAVLLLATAPALAADPPGLVTKTYPVGDLIFTVAAPAPTPAPAPVMQMAVPAPAVPIPVATAPYAVHLPLAVEGVRIAPPPMPTSAKRNADSLARIVATTIKPQSWTEYGGAGTIRYDEAKMCLVVTQTADVQAHVAELLTTLQKLQAKAAPQVLVQMTVIEATPDVVAKFATGSCCEGQECKHSSNKSVIGLTPAQMESVNVRIREAKSDGLIDILARPQLIVVEGQTGTFQVGQRVPLQTGVGPGDAKVETAETGILTTVTPTVSADRKSVTLRLNYTHSAVNPTPIILNSPEKPGAVITATAIDTQSLQTTVALPDGGTGLILGPVRTCETKTEKVLPLLSNVPHLQQLFKAVETGTEKRQQVIVVTPRVVMQPPMPVAPPMHVTAPKPVPPPTRTEALVAAYRKACAEGRTEDAMKYAMQALALDPKCFANEK